MPRLPFPLSANSSSVRPTPLRSPFLLVFQILQNDHYDSKCDVYSFGICLVAMVRAESDTVRFFFEGLRRDMKKKTCAGIGINLLNARMISKGFRPKLPGQLYPSLKKLIGECWLHKAEDRPTMDDIVARLSGEIFNEVARLPEPNVEEGAEDVLVDEDVVERREVETSFNAMTARDITELKTNLEEERKKRIAAEKEVEEEKKMRSELEIKLQLQ